MTLRIASLASVMVSILMIPAYAQERRDLSETVLKSDYLNTYLERLENQHSDFRTWFPEDRLNAATIISFIEYEDGVVFVSFSQETAASWTEARGWVVFIAGPAVVFPVFPDDGHAKFKHNRYVGVVKEADWSKRDRHFWDKGITVAFGDGSGGHGRLVRVMEFNITDRLIGEAKPDDEGRDRRLTDRESLSRLMGVYFRGFR